MNLLSFLVSLFSKPDSKPDQAPLQQQQNVPDDKPMELKQKFVKVGSSDEGKERYGEIKDQKWVNEGAWMTVYVVPIDIAPKWINTATGKGTGKIYVNKDMKTALDQALCSLRASGLLSELKTFDGCFCVRDVRGVPGKTSWHSYGLAIDVNAAENALGKDPKLSTGFVKCFTDAGFTWGGTFSRKDGMHFQFAE